MHEAFFFGPSANRLFATYHPPAAGTGRILSILCPPLFTDYMRIHPAMRELAASLAQKNQHVIRFDFRGTGDSFGELDQVSLSDWLEDIALVVEEGREISECSEVRMLGIRASALLACKAMGANSPVRRFVMWDPVPDGSTYLRAARTVQGELCRRNIFLDRRERSEALREFSGHLISPRMAEELGSLNASVYSEITENMLHAVCTSPDLNFPFAGGRRTVTPFRCDWDTISTELIVARPVIERLAECLT